MATSSRSRRSTPPAAFRAAAAAGRASAAPSTHGLAIGAAAAPNGRGCTAPAAAAVERTSGGRRGSICAFPWSPRRLWDFDYPHGTGGGRLCGTRAAVGSGAGAVGGAVERVADRSPTAVVWLCTCVDRHVLGVY